MLDEGVSGLIGRIYDVADGAGQWQPVLRDICESTNSRSALLCAIDIRERSFDASCWHGPQDALFWDGVNQYSEEVHHADPTKAFGARYPDAGFTSVRRAIESQGGDPRDHPYLRWLGDTLRVGDCASCYTPANREVMLALSIHPHVDRGAHDESELALFRLLFGHVDRAMRLALRPPRFDDPKDMLFAIDRRGMVMTYSPAADRLLSGGGALRLVNRRLLAADVGATRRLEAAIMEALAAADNAAAGQAVLLPDRNGASAYAAVVSPLIGAGAAFASFGPAVLVRIVDMAAAPRAGLGARWRSIYGLTAAEARVAEAIHADQEGLPAIAERLGIAYTTARAHLRALFDKTGTRTQAQLVRLLTRLE